MTDIYFLFQISITLLVAFVYLSSTLQKYILKDIYDFLMKYKDVIIGIYYCYLAYELYRNNILKEQLKI